MPLIVLSVLVQVALVVHIVKTGRNTTWIWIVVILPVAGSIAYLLLEALPDFMNTKSGRSAGRKIQSVVNPNKDINEATKQFSISDSVENSIKLAEECFKKGLYADAKELFSKCLRGVHADDPDLMFGLAKSDYELDNFSGTRSTLEKLIELNPGYKNQEAHLLYARTLEALGEVTSALHEYETLHGYFSGPKASYHFGKFLQAQNQQEKANEVFNHILRIAKNSPSHYRSVHKEIIRLAKIEASS
jgi:hypothetical protein